MLRLNETALLLNALQPPQGMSIDAALGTSFTLDLTALLSIPVAASFERQDAHEPADLLETVRRYADRTILFCQAGAISVPARYRAAHTLIEDTVVEVRRPDGGLFHPKLWVIRFKKGDSYLHRVLVMSRNLTFDRAWDVLVRLDEDPDADGAVDTSGLLELLGELRGMAVRSMTSAQEKLLTSILSSVGTASLALPAPFATGKFVPFLPGARSWPFRSRYDAALAVSPFLTGGAAARFFKPGAKRKVIVSRQGELNAQAAALASVHEVYRLKDALLSAQDDLEALDGGPGASDDTGVEAPSLKGLHAKFYVQDHGARATVWLGSANLTDAAFSTNVDLLVELTGSVQDVGVECVLAQKGRKDVNQYRHIDPRNGRLRWLLEDLDAASAFDVLWVPPALPQTQLGGRYATGAALTKRLIFSSWSVVPKSVAALTSYEFERRHGRVASGQTERPSYNKVREGSRPFDLTTLHGTAMDNFTGWFALLLPCKYLADIGDPLAVASALGETVPLSLAALRRHVTEVLETRLAPLLSMAPPSGAGRSIWYSAAQLWLDPDLAELTAEHWIGTERDSQAFREHWTRLVEVAGSPDTWGPWPSDLVRWLTDLAIAGPAICALRAIRRQRSRFDTNLTAHALRASTASIAWAFTSFFNAAEAQAIVESSVPVRLDHWKKLLVHCAEGGLGSVLDEWFHLIPDQCRLNKASDTPLKDMAALASEVLRLNDGRSFSDFYDRIRRTGEARSHALRSHFAMRYGQARGATAEGENPVAVRNAFNSPFRPFVLVSTSVGQEGLDFHYYAHAIVHWNLPGNPVDLEQREGRVHRYKNHAVRKNVAARFAHDPAILTSTDPWEGLFALATDKKSSDGGLRPHWIYDGEAQIKRLVPMLPFSREVGKLQQLVEATSLYRMTIGQPRQAELMEVLAGLSKEEQDTLRAAVSIDLKPSKS